MKTVSDLFQVTCPFVTTHIHCKDSVVVILYILSVPNKVNRVAFWFLFFFFRILFSGLWPASLATDSRANQPATLERGVPLGN